MCRNSAVCCNWEDKRGVCVCVNREVLVFVHKQFTLWCKEKYIFWVWDRPSFFFSKREHWYLVVCVCVCVCVCLCSVAQLCPTLCKPMDCSLPGSSIHGILPARTLEWVAISYSRRSSQLKDQTHISYISCITGGVFTAEWPGKSASF